MAARRAWGGFVSAALVAALALGAVPAFAVADDVPPTVAVHVTVAGADLIGMTAAQAHDAITAACATPTLAPLAAVADKKPFSLDVAAAVTCDIDGMVADALAASTDTSIAPRWAADPAAVTAFVARVAKAANRKPVDAKRTIVKHRLKVAKQVEGVSVVTTAAVAAVTDAVTAELGADGSLQPTVPVPVTVVRAKTTTSNIGKTIVVVIHERRVYLYKNTKLEKSYRCAVGMRRYPTPTGTFKVVSKSPHPAWHNPGSAWAKGMPSYIKPGYYNPLGLRALYLSAPGIRIHGTAKTSSMGRAASHGCIRLTNHNILDLYPRVPVGTPAYLLS